MDIHIRVSQKREFKLVEKTKYNRQKSSLEGKGLKANVENKPVLSDFINLTQVHNFTVSAQDMFTFRRLSVFTVSFTRILQVLMQIMKRFALYYCLVKWFWYKVYNQKVLSSSPRKFFFCIFTSLFDSFNFIIIDVP